jgi:hypothetical protein
VTLKRIDGKETRQYTINQYESALVADKKLHLDRFGELVIDMSTDPDSPSVWVANVTGHLIPVGSGGGITPPPESFAEFVANGISIDAAASTTVEFAPTEVQFCGTTMPTVGVEVDPTTTPPQVHFRVTPTGIPVDCPFIFSGDFSTTGNTLVPDFNTLGDEFGAWLMWDMAKTPLAGLLCYDLGSL